MSQTLEDRTILITGANTGIGRAAATELARRGATLVLACRSAAKTTPVIAEMQRASGNPRIEFLSLDLADLASVRSAAASFLASGRPLHVLLNNAGLAGQRGSTRDGFELAFGTNHLGHFLFTNLLLDRLRAGAPARIVNVASMSHYDASGIDFDAVRRPTASLTGLSEYAVSKLANVLFTQELARRLERSGVTTYAVHPGVVASDVWRGMPWPLLRIYQWLKPMKTNEEGAEPLLRCAIAAELADETGRYYHRHHEKAANPKATAALAAELWRRSAEWTGLAED